MPKPLRRPLLAAVITVLACAVLPAAHADTLWKWSFTGKGVTARGVLTTADAGDAQGFHRITSIEGRRNGEEIAALFPAGSAIPGNEGYPVDNLIRYDEGGMLTILGLGYCLKSGACANVFYDLKRTPAVYQEMSSRAGKMAETEGIFTAAPVVERAGSR
ncbi:hypothetical protein [Derxia gummosa]|uniref:Lipoprotein n=1 Tax=Derxia gummosa DSM 723 TaxID=1121388 RepID=A0A8B6XAB4_9BURK|nr:hypothetical protein [Derxia gummosa]